MKFLSSLPLIALLLAAAPTASAEEAAASATITAGDFEFALPTPWADSGNTRPMVKAIAVWTDPDGTHEPIDAAFYHFGEGQGGTVQANVDRWKGQFQGEVEEDYEDLDLDGQRVTIVHLRGTYMDGPMFGNKTPKDGHAMLGAIIESAGGHVFIKATAPEEAIAACRESFRALAMSPFQ